MRRLSKTLKKSQCPLLSVLWAAAGAMGKLYDVLSIWKDEGVANENSPVKICPATIPLQ